MPRAHVLALSFLFLFLIMPSRAIAAERQAAIVKEALTGDSVRLEGGKVLKYAGADAPPLQHLLPLVRQYGHQAFEFNKSLVEGKKIWVEWDALLRDDQKRLLGYVFLEDGTFVNKALLEAGHARSRVQAPNVRYAKEFRLAALGARREKKGLWKEEPENPFLKSEYLGEKNTKRYYFPTSPELETIPEANLVRFSSRVAAKAAGYRPCSTCYEGEEGDF